MDKTFILALLTFILNVLEFIRKMNNDIRNKLTNIQSPTEQSSINASEHTQNDSTET